MLGNHFDSFKLCLRVKINILPRITFLQVLFWTTRVKKNMGPEATALYLPIDLF